MANKVGEEENREMDEEDETKWIRNRLKCRECTVFLPQNEKSLCQCGHKKGHHSSTAQSATNAHDSERWDYKNHSTQETTNAFGEIEFVGYGGKIAKYVRVDVDTKMSDMLDLMMNVWGMEKPNLLISVTGGAKNFKMSKRLKEKLRRRLKKTALTTGAWIITGGTHVGVTKLVGEAVKDFEIASSTQNPVVAIGIAPWGCVQNRDTLINEECYGLWPAHYRIGKKNGLNECFLDPNHSHFILVDNATEKTFDVEILFRSKLESEIANKQEDTDAVHVSTVLLMLEGGIGTLETVHEAIRKNTPVVIVKESGRAAKILTYAYQNAKVEAKDREGNPHKTMDDNLRIQVEKMMKDELGSNDIVKHMKWIEECLDKSDLLSVLDIDKKTGSWKIDVSMLQALLKTNKNGVMDQLRLALAWNRIDVAKNDIFTDDNRWLIGSLDNLMLSAIQLNRPEFVELFMDHGVSLQDFLTKERLLLLYNKIPMNCLLRSLLDKVNGKTEESRKNSLRDVGSLMRELLGDYFQYIYTTNDENACLGSENGGQMGTDATAGDFDNPAQELFLWSVLMIRQDLAKIFWEEGKDAIAGALVANSILKAMKGKTEDTELAIKIQEHIDEWSNLAIGVLNECHSTDERKAQDLLIRKLGNWGDATCMLIAVKADNKEFISQTACQLLFNSIWMGKLTQENHALKLFLCIFLPPLALWLVRYHMSPDNVDTKDQKQPTSDKGKSALTVSARGNEKDTKEVKKDNQPTFKSHMEIIRDRFYYFFNAPVIIFMYNVVSYLVFLSLFTYILLFDFNPSVTRAEMFLMVWVFTIFTEEIRQVAMTSSSTFTTKLQRYVTDEWNIVDLITIGLFVFGVVLRFVPDPDAFEAARVCLALNFFTFFLRMLHMFSVHKELGPKLVMIRIMVRDLMYFVLILMVFVVSYAIASHSILFPNSPLNWETINTVIRRSYWNIYGELFLEEIEGQEDCTFDEALWMNDSLPRCPSELGKYFVHIMMGVYMLLANVLLLSLLIAMFSYTFQAIQDNTDKHWFYQRYSLIHEYYTRPILCPPFILLAHIYLLIKYIMGKFCKRDCDGENDNEDNDFRRRFTNEQELVYWENVAADAFRHKSEQKQFQSTDYKVANTHGRLMMLFHHVNDIQEQINQQTAAQVTELPAQLEKRLASLEQQVTRK